MKQIAPDQMREIAEKQLSDRPKLRPRSPEKLLYELEVHQIELEMQNEALRQSQAELEVSRDRYLDFFDFAPGGYITLDLQGMIVEINLTCAALLGVDRNKLPYKRMASYIAVEDRERWHLQFVSVLNNDGVMTCELAIEYDGRKRFYARLDCLRLCKSGASPGVRIVLTDITAHKRAESDIAAVRNQLQATLEAIPDLLFEVGLDGHIYDYHPHRGDMLAVPPDTFLGKCYFDAFPVAVADVWRLALSDAYKNGHSFGQQFELQFPYGTFWFELSVSCKKFKQEQAHRFIVLARNITERKRAENEIVYLAFHDVLTGLPNRRALNERLEQTMAVSNRNGHYGALIQGHDVGDLLLVEVAHRISSCVRSMDVVARYGGDEYMVMLAELDTDMDKSVAEAGNVAEKIRALLATPYLLKTTNNDPQQAGIAHRCTSSIGVAMFINHQVSADEIVKFADMAMYQAKEAGRNLIRFYHPQISAPNATTGVNAQSAHQELVAR
jgi:diguanylate cyclase (GGDEF)-like protein/PAS domain S-box-containing protein